MFRNYLWLVAIYSLSFTGCSKDRDTPRDSLVRGTWVLFYYSVQQSGAGVQDWHSMHDGDTRDYLDFHPDGTVESGDAWNGRRRGNYELGGDDQLRMEVSSRTAAIPVRITELTGSSLSLVEEFEVGGRRVINRYQYSRR